jgi:hypothetical protein
MPPAGSERGASARPATGSRVVDARDDDPQTWLTTLPLLPLRAERVIPEGTSPWR